MNRPPMLMHIKIRNEDNNFGLWLPLFLLIPLVLVVLIILSPLILVALLVLWWCGWGSWARFALNSVKMAFLSLWAMRGLKVDVQNRHEVVYISIV